MADGDNLIIGAQNQGDAETKLDRAGMQIRTALVVTNANGSGIQGDATDPNPNSIGVWGQSTNGTGVFARGTPGLKALSSRGNAIEANTDSGFGLTASSKDGTGVQATGERLGVEAFSTGRDGAAGVRGTATRGVEGFGTEIGVAGTVNTSAGGPRTAFVGVSGRSNSSHGVFGKSTAPGIGGVIVGGVTGVSNQNGVVGESTGGLSGVLGRSTAGIGIHGIGGGFAGFFEGNVIVFGDFAVTGRKSAVLRDSSGKYRRMYSVESPESWLEDFGSAKLVRGRVRVRLKPDFSQFIATKDYHVFLTPEGESNGLYVERKTSAGFYVAEQQKGRSNIRFSYRIVAKRRDLQGRRLEEFKLPKKLPKLDGKIREPRMPEPPAELKILLRAPRTKRKPKKA